MPHGLRRFWNRQLPNYPDTGPRMLYLGITVLATITLYYELYIQGAVATKIIAEFHFTFTEFVFVLVIGNAVGAFASLGAGLADRWGRANLVVGGLLLTGLLVLFALPNATSKAEYTFFFALVSIVEGVALVATPALIRDFSPQVGRSTAMGFWTMGPVLGSLVVTEVSSHTLARHPDWRFQFHLCGIVGLVVWRSRFVGLRELSPRLRDQLMVSIRDRALVEARAAGLDPETALKGHWRQMLRLDIVGPAGSGVAYVAWMAAFTETVEKHNPAATATGLAVWGWIIRIVVTVSFAILPTVVPATGTLVDKGAQVQAIVAKYPQQVKTLQTVSPGTLTALKINPNNKTAQASAVAQISGLSVTQVAKTVALGAQLKAGGALKPADAAFLQANGPKVQKAGAQLQALAKVPPADVAYLAQHGGEVAKAKADNAGQWQTWWWICFAGQVFFIPFVFLLTGRWNPRKAREDEREHERVVERELATLRGQEVRA